MARAITKVLRRALVVLVFGCPLIVAGSTQGDEPRSNVLVIYSSPRGGAAVDDFHAAFIRAVRASPDVQVEVHSESFDVVAGQGENYERAMAEYLRQKYAGVRMDLIVGVSATAIRLVGPLRDQVFPGVPIVFGAVDRRVIEEGPPLPGAVGVASLVDIRGTISAALACRPGTKHVAFVLGSTQLELAWRQRFMSEIVAVDPNLVPIDLAGLEVQDLLAKLETLPDDTIILWGTFLRDSRGSVSSPADIIEEACDVASVPIFGVFEHQLGSGIVGGSLGSYSESGELTGQVVLRRLRGEIGTSERVVAMTECRFLFDARELARWRIPESRLPAGAVVRFREPTIWQLYGNYLAIGLSVMLLQAMLIAGLLVQRSRRVVAQGAVARQLEFEKLHTALSNRLADVSPARVDAVVATAMEEARGNLEADRLSLVQFGEDSGVAAVRHSAADTDVTPLDGTFNLEAYPEVVALIKQGWTVRVDTLDSIRTSMAATYDSLKRAGIESVAVVPVHIGGEIIGMLGAASVRDGTAMSDENIARLQFLADIFANALARRNAAEKVHRSEELSHAVLGSIAAQVCVIDGESRVVTGNDAWKKSWIHPEVDVTCSLMRRRCGDACLHAATCTNAEAIQARRGIIAVMTGDLPTFSLEYRRSEEADTDWYVMTAERLQLPEGGAVVSNQNITARKRAELEAEQRRQELTHFSRVSTMGELAASLAHELNQPLTGVLTNAQAAIRYLDADPPNVGEVREILDDIIEDDRRAGEVIRRLRAMLQSGRVEQTDLDLNDVVGTVLKFVASDAIIRDVSIETTLAGRLAPVSGDRIQLQQVVLNLVTNAMDAVREHPDRTVTVQTQQTDAGNVRLSVSDVGHGIDPDKLDAVFMPFYTTKSEGLGMGLSIARTIIEAHGGTLWAENNPERGASFLFSIPSSRSMSA